MNDDTCPVCHRQTEDMRHVDVECFYQVNERAPHLYEHHRYARIPSDGAYLGRVYRAPRLDEKHYDVKRTAPGHTTLTPRWEEGPDEPVYLRGFSVYGTRCCKRCRADFIALFLRWSRGQYATPEPRPDEDRNIPVRENGAVVMLTRAEWDARQANREEQS